MKTAGGGTVNILTDVSFAAFSQIGLSCARITPQEEQQGSMQCMHVESLDTTGESEIPEWAIHMRY